MTVNEINFPDFFSNVKYGTTTLDNIRDLVPLLENTIDVNLLKEIDSPILFDMSNLPDLIYESFQSEINGTKHLLQSIN